MLTIPQSFMDAAAKQAEAQLAGQVARELEKATGADPAVVRPVVEQAVEAARRRGLTQAAALAVDAALSALGPGLREAIEDRRSEANAADDTPDEALWRTVSEVSPDEWERLSAPIRAAAEGTPAADAPPPALALVDSLKKSFPQAPPNGVRPCSHGGAKMSKPPPTSTEPTTWIGVSLVDESGRPMVDERWEVVDAKGRRFSGSFDKTGEVIVQGVAPGAAKVVFPGLDRSYFQVA